MRFLSSVLLLMAIPSTAFLNIQPEVDSRATIIKVTPKKGHADYPSGFYKLTDSLGLKKDIEGNRYGDVHGGIIFKNRYGGPFDAFNSAVVSTLRKSGKVSKVYFLNPVDNSFYTNRIFVSKWPPDSVDVNAILDKHGIEKREHYPGGTTGYYVGDGVVTGIFEIVKRLKDDGVSCRAEPIVEVKTNSN